MSDQYVVVDGPVVNWLGPEFEDLTEAVDFANANSITGTVDLAEDYKLTAQFLATRLSGLVGVLKLALRAEAERRIILADPAASYDIAYTLHLGGHGGALAAIAAVVPATFASIDALADVAAADAYDVVTDPSWP